MYLLHIPCVDYQNYRYLEHQNQGSERGKTLTILDNTFPVNFLKVHNSISSGVPYVLGEHTCEGNSRKVEDTRGSDDNWLSFIH